MTAGVDRRVVGLQADEVVTVVALPEIAAEPSAKAPGKRCDFRYSAAASRRSAQLRDSVSVSDVPGGV